MVVDFLKHLQNQISGTITIIWFYLKYNRLPNFAPPTIEKLRRSVESEIKRLQGSPDLLRSFICQSGVPLVL
jgi:hypothetical protein